jgi:signal peptidase I
MMGDNRMNSEDSRYWGALDERMVLGRAWIIWWSFSEGDYDYLRNSAGDTVRRLVDKVAHFFGKTRWDRIGMRPR